MGNILFRDKGHIRGHIPQTFVLMDRRLYKATTLLVLSKKMVGKNNSNDCVGHGTPRARVIIIILFCLFWQMFSLFLLGWGVGHFVIVEFIMLKERHILRELKPTTEERFLDWKS